MARNRTSGDVRQHDLRKYTVLLIFAVVLIILFIVNGLRGVEPVAEIQLELTPVPTYTAAGNVVRPVLISPAPGDEIRAGVVLLVGTGAPDAPIQIVVDGSIVAEATSDADGNWQAEVELMTPGENEVVVQATDLDTSEEPIRLVIAVPVVEVQPPSLDLSILESEITSGEIALQGTGEPGTELQVLVNGELAETAVVDENGEWTVQTGLAEPGQYAVSLSSLDESGSVAAMATAVSVDVLSAEGDVEETAEPAMVETGAEETSADAGAVEPTDQPVTVEVQDAVVPPGFVTLSGTGSPQDEVTISVDDTVVGRATVEPDSTWMLVTRIDEPGDYMISAADSAGISSASAVLTVADGASASVAVSADRPSEVAIVPEDTESRRDSESDTDLDSEAPSIDGVNVAGNASEPQPFVEIRGSGTAGDELSLLIDEGVVGRTLVDTDATWQYVTRLAQPGEYSIIASSQNGVRSEPFVLVLPLVQDAPPTIVEEETSTPSVAESIEASDIAATGDDAVDSADVVTSSVDAELGQKPQPVGFITLSGSGPANQVIQVLIDESVVGRVTSDANGRWDLVTRLDLPGTVAVSAIDEDGTRSSPVELEIVDDVEAAANGEAENGGDADAAAPVTAAPTVETPVVEANNEANETPVDATDRNNVVGLGPVIEGDLQVDPDLSATPLAAGFVTLAGFGPADSEVQVLIEKAAVGRAQTDAEGRWSFVTRLNLPGSYEVAVADDDGMSSEPVVVEVVEKVILATAVPATTPDRALVVVAPTPPLPGETPEAPEDEIGEESAIPASTSTATLEARFVPVATATDVTPELSPESTATSTNTPLPMSTPESTSTETLTPVATATDVTPEPTATETNTPEPTSTPTDTPVPTETPTETPEPTSTSTDTPVPTETPTATPVPPVIESFSLEKGLDGNVVQLEGSGIADSVLEIQLNASTVASTTVDADSRWSMVVPIEESGEYTFDVQTLDAAGDLLAKSAPVTVNVVPTPTATSTETPTVTPEPTSTETLTPVATATDVTPEPTATETNTPEPTSTSTDTPVPTETPTETPEPTSTSTDTPVPTDTAVPTETPEPTETPTATPIPPVIESFSLEKGLDGNVVQLEGSGIADSVLEIQLNDSTVVSTTVDADNRWSMVVPIEESGEYTFDVRALDADGDLLAESAPVTVNVVPTPTSTSTETPTVTPEPTSTETITPIATATDVTPEPTATSTETPVPTSTSTDTPVPTETPTEKPTNTPVPTSTATPIAPAIDPSSLAADFGDEITSITGAGEPGTMIELLVNGRPAGTTDVNETGKWTLDLALDDPGEYILEVRPAQEDDVVRGVILVPTPTALPTSTPTETPEPTNTVKPTSTSTETPTPEPTATDTPTATATPLPPSIDPESIPAEMLPGSIPLSGFGEPMTSVDLLVNGIVATTVDVGEEGEWEAEVTLDESGIYALNVQADRGDGTIVTGAQALIARIAAPTDTPEPTSTSTDTPEPTATATDVPTDTPEPTSITIHRSRRPITSRSRRQRRQTFRPTHLKPTSTSTDTPEPTATATDVPTDTPEPTSTSTDTPEPTATATDVPTDTPEPTSTSTDTPEPTSTSTDTPEPTATATDVPTDTPEPTSTSTDTPEPTATATDVPTDTPEPTSTSTDTPEPTATATDVPTDTPEPTSTSTDTPEPTSTSTDTPEPTATATDVPTDTPEPTSTSTDTPEPTATATDVPTDTPEPTSTPIDTPEPTRTAMPLILNASVIEGMAGTRGLSGSGEPGTVVEIVANSRVIGEATVDEDGNWAYDANLTQPGIYALGARILNPDGSIRSIAVPVFLTVPATSTPEPTSTATSTPEPTATSTATDVPTNTPVPTSTPTNTPEPPATFTKTPVPTATFTTRQTPVPTATPTNTPVPTSTPTNTPEPTATFTKTPVPTSTPTNTPAANGHIHEDAGADGHTDQYTGADQHTDQYARANGHIHEDAGADGHTDQYTGADQHTDQYARANGHIHEDAGADGHTDQYTGADQHTDQYARTNGNIHEDAGADCDRNGQADEHTPTHSHIHAASCTSDHGLAGRYLCWRYQSSRHRSAW